MSATPETDCEMLKWNRHSSPGVSANFARKLERERDVLRNLLSVALKSGLTDQVRTEARQLLNDH